MGTHLLRRSVGTTRHAIAIAVAVAMMVTVAPTRGAQEAPARESPARESPSQESRVQPAQPLPFPDDPIALTAEGNKAKAQGAYDKAEEYYQRALKLDSRLFEARLGLGMTLDLQGNYAEAQKELDKALTSASPDNNREQRDAALTALAVSNAFAGKLDDAQRYYEKLYDYQISTQRLDKAATTAQTLGRAYLEAGDTKNAAQWYQTGQDAVKKMSGLPSEEIDLWQMRWEHAQSRLAARQGQQAEADAHLAAAKALLDKGGANAGQTANYQYAVGYNAFYAGDYAAAVEALLKADPRDPSTLMLLAEAYAKKGDPEQAKVVASKVGIVPLHTLNGALARRDAKKLEERLAKEAKEREEKAQKEKAEKEKAAKEP